MTAFYEMAEPSEWAEAPGRFSFSSLQAITNCPRQWQLLHSSWGEYARFPERSHPKALEGQIVHEAIEHLMKILGKNGLPRIGTPRFQEALTECGFWEFFVSRIQTRNAILSEHPRFGPYFVIRTSPRELANRTIRLFREQYVPMDMDAPRGLGEQREQMASATPMDLLLARGVLTEFELDHPTLPIRGVIDLVDLVEGQARVVDFKTGRRKEEHDLQVKLYAVLWWRKTGMRPERVALQYLDGRREFEVAADELVETERCATQAIKDASRELANRPARARPGDSCIHCPVGARCDDGWTAFVKSTPPASARNEIADIELVVASQPAPTGFVGDVMRREVAVVYDPAVGGGLTDIKSGDRLRLLDVVVREEGSTFEVRPWTEVYRMPN